MKKTNRELKKAVIKAKNSWLKHVFAKVNGREATRPSSQKEIWELVRLIRDMRRFDLTL
jgi:hypothetical protein